MRVAGEASKAVDWVISEFSNDGWSISLAGGIDCDRLEWNWKGDAGASVVGKIKISVRSAAIADPWWQALNLWRWKVKSWWRCLHMELIEVECGSSFMIGVGIHMLACVRVLAGSS